ncbi:SRPBCC domain-containing protein [Cognatishimia sp. SS12]|uniref:SRPBCC family protein n=1 Tax=Cognatishimia sp. SS12 TaxID=2979465 RepID=UPI002330E2A2|nr:SRPBCC domain-containing protein [Cognatishimia sp. SS12]MDC0737634.1 SRPBCC domain-containing protein [Cognatishimia sp. SS12]
MTDIRLEREFAVSQERLFDFVTKRHNVLEWFGYEGMTFPADDMDFSRTGPWFVDMRTKDGNPLKLSGHVTHVKPPDSVGFTWAWHDPEGKRGAESHVTMTVVETANGAKLIVDHRDLADGDIGANHEAGWTYALRTMERILQG